jgi:hypothetical protein
LLLAGAQLLGCAWTHSSPAESYHPHHEPRRQGVAREHHLPSAAGCLQPPRPAGPANDIERGDGVSMLPRASWRGLRGGLPALLGPTGAPGAAAGEISRAAAGEPTGTAEAGA